MPDEKLLIVDDERLTSEALRYNLQLDGYHVDTASSASEALALLERQVYPVVLTDLRMPGASGLDVARQALSLTPPTAVIIVSGYASPAEEAEIHSVGAGFLRKPFDAEGARKVILEALGSF